MSGRKHKPRGRRPKYLPGVTWRDVLKGNPVTVEEREREKNPRPTIDHRCRDCGLGCRLYKSIGWQDRTRRCVKCGGVLDPAPE